MKQVIDTDKVTFPLFLKYVEDNRERLELRKKQKRGGKCPLNFLKRHKYREAYMQSVVDNASNTRVEVKSLAQKAFCAMPFLRKPMAFIRFELSAAGFHPFQSHDKRNQETVDYLDNYAFVHEHLSDDASKRIYALRLMANVVFVYPYCTLAHCLSGEQYFDACMPYTEKECFVDCGAFVGDTLSDFIKYVGKPKRYFAFEPDNDNRLQLENSIRKAELSNCVTVYPYGVFNKSKRVSFKSNGSNSTIVEDGDGDASIDVVRLDDVINEPITTIKMDIEGAELSALKGAERLIREYHPKLAICIYHSVTDLWEIASYIIQQHPSYTHFYIRHHSDWFNETVLYAF